MKPICDYQGNEIKEGMTLVQIRTKMPFSHIIQYKITPKGTKENVIDVKQDVWTLGQEYRVFKDENGILRYEMIINSPDPKGSGVFHFFLENLYHFADSNYIIAIKGISDQRPEK